MNDVVLPNQILPPAALSISPSNHSSMSVGAPVWLLMSWPHDNLRIDNVPGAQPLEVMPALETLAMQQPDLTYTPVKYVGLENGDIRNNHVMLETWTKVLGVHMQ